MLILVSQIKEKLSRVDIKNLNAILQYKTIIYRQKKKNHKS